MDPAAVRRAARWLVIASLALLNVESAPAATQDFASWLDELAAEARERGVSQRALDTALDGIAPIPRILELDRSQPKAPAQFCSYIKRRLTRTRIARGRRLLAEQRELLEQVRADYGVPPRFVVALWGLETNFGDYLGDYPVIHALATLAHDPRRSELFRRQLLAALQIVDEGHQSPAKMKGSWAGAFGQVQLLPTTFLDYAVDHDGDGRKNVWSSLPDAFATAANYLVRSGWRVGETWGREVTVPSALKADRAALKRLRPLADWSAKGVRRMGGGELPVSDMRGRIVVPSRKTGDAFLVYSNFGAIMRWNESTFFAVSVGAFADEISKTASLRACRS